MSARRHAALPREAVVLVHGLWVGNWAMTLLSRRLSAAGFAAIPFGYPSVTETLAENALRLSRFVSGIDAPALHFLAHSLGGIVVHRALSEFPIARPGRAVLLGSPLRGSFAARRLSRRRFGETVLGHTAREWLSCGPAEWNLPQQLGIIAGSRSMGIGHMVVPDLPRPNDGVVSVEETIVPGAHEHAVLAVAHSEMLVSRRVAGLVTAFLRSGSFA